MANSFLKVTHFTKTRIALHQITNDEGHLHNELPVSILTCTILLLFRTVLVPAFICLAIFLCPSHCLLIFLVVVDTLFHTTKNLSLIYALIAHTKVLLEEILIYDTTCDTHALATDREVALATHRSDSKRSACPTKNLFCNILWDAVICNILYIVAIDAKCRQALLSMTSQYCCQIYSTWTLSTIETPNCLWPMRMHVHGL